MNNIDNIENYNNNYINNSIKSNSGKDRVLQIQKWKNRLKELF